MSSVFHTFSIYAIGHLWITRTLHAGRWLRGGTAASQKLLFGCEPGNVTLHMMKTKI
jgi:hypothetical protein